jgi:hypothetical protein
MAICAGDFGNVVKAARDINIKDEKEGRPGFLPMISVEYS